MAEDEFAALVEDIRAHGVRQPVVVTRDGYLADGRHRQRACQVIGIEAPIQVYDGPTDGLLDYVVSANLHRRHLTSGQKAMIAVDLVTTTHGGDRRSDQAADLPLVTQAAAAAALGVSERSVRDAAALRRQSSELADQVRAGTLALNRAVHDRTRAAGLAANAERIASGQFFDDVQPGQRFKTIVIDPPWRWSDENPERDEDMYERGVPYATMTVPQIRDWVPTTPGGEPLVTSVASGGRGVGDLGEDNSHLYLWITNARLEEGFALMRAWGYEYKTTLTWVKPRFGIGYYFRGQTEHVLFGVRGRQELLNRNTGTVFFADRGAGGHSSKPDEFYELVERTSPGPWVDVFGRRHVRPGWAVIGVDSGDDPGSEAALDARTARRTWRLTAKHVD
jgi:N6-adenosine-specific RNA methylase IME4/ParB-like chromosome segregation protein Spo0J